MITITDEMLKMTPMEIVSFIKGNGYEEVEVPNDQEELIRRLKKEKIKVYDRPK